MVVWVNVVMLDSVFISLFLSLLVMANFVFCLIRGTRIFCHSTDSNRTMIVKHGGDNPTKNI